MLDLILFVAAASADGGIHTLACDRETGALRALAFTPLPGAGYLVLSPDRTRLYAAVSESATFRGDGEVAAFAVTPDGALTFLNSLPSGGLSCCHLTLAGKYLYCANYRGGTVGEFRLAEDGRLERRTQLLRHEGRGVHPTRQTEAHPHFVAVTPDARFLAAVDLGCDGLFFYPLDPETGVAPTPAGFSRALPGEGPRHLVFNPAGTLAYVANELGNTVAVCAYANGALALRQTVATLPPDFAQPSTVAAIRMSPDGKHLFCSNRGHDSIAVFDVRADGTLVSAGHTPAGGSGPRDFVAFGDKGFIAVANEKSNTVVVLNRVSAGNGATHEVSATLPIASRPICVLPFR